jgi:hypothetical protein
MKEVLMLNPAFATLVITAIGGILAVSALTEFIKSIISDAKNAPRPEGAEKPYFETRNGMRLIVIAAAGLYSLVVYLYNGLNGPEYTEVGIVLRYFTFWVALSAVTMGAYDLLRNNRGNVGIHMMPLESYDDEHDPFIQIAPHDPEKPKN